MLTNEYNSYSTVDGSKKSLMLSLQVLESFRTVSGLQLDNKKLKNFVLEQTLEEMKYSALKKFKWVKNKVKALGIWFSTDPEVTMEVNY